jgi:hypothetical protein
MSLAQAKARVSNQEVQAPNVLMRKWHVTSESRLPDAEAMIVYNDLYNSPLRSSQCKAIRAFLLADCPPPVVDVMGIELLIDKLALLVLF